MGKVSRLFKGELKKIFLSTGIFFMVAFLILVLTIAPKFFNPTQKQDIYSSLTMSTTDVKSVYDSFLDNKDSFDNKLEEIKGETQALININTDFAKELNEKVDEIYSLRVELNSLIFTGTVDKMKSCLVDLIKNVEEFEEKYSEYLEDYIFPLILVDEDLDTNIKFETSELLKKLNKKSSESETSSKEFYIALDDALNNSKEVYNIKNYVSSIKGLEYDNENLEKFIEDFYNNPIKYKQELSTKIESNYNKSTTDDEFNISDNNIEETLNLSYKYFSLNNSCYHAIYDSLFIEVSSSVSDAEISKYLGFEDLNSYKLKENLSKHTYLIENKLYDSDFANMFSFNTNTSNETNAFDYMYFTLEIASIFIIAFTVIIGASMIAKEHTNGTIKLLAIRPYKRSKIMMAKILATMFFAFIFVLTTTIVSLITGYIIYGISFPSMLVTLNASVTFTLPIWVVFLIYLVCLMIKIWVFALLAITISTIFKSYIAAVCVSSGIYILNLILTFVSKGAYWLKYNIFANLDLFKYFGGSFITSYTANQNLTNLFLSPVFPDTSMILSAIIIVSLILVLNIITFTIFKHRDIT